MILGCGRRRRRLSLAMADARMAVDALDALTPAPTFLDAREALLREASGVREEDVPELARRFAALERGARWALLLAVHGGAVQRVPGDTSGEEDAP